MGVEAEAVSTHKEAESRERAVAVPGREAGFDPLADRVLGGSPAPDAAARSLKFSGLSSPILQRAQRLYGNRASQQMVQRDRVLQRQCACGGTCDKCRQGEERSVLQRKAEGNSSPEFHGIPDTQSEPLGVESQA